MRKMMMAGVASLAIVAAMPAMAQNKDADAAAGGFAGGAAGGTIGFLVGGPVGAVIGGFTGAVLGAEAAVPEQTIVYAGNNPVEEVYLDSNLTVGATVPESVTLYRVEPTPQYAYVYANNRVYIVDPTSREVVYSPGYTVPREVVSYVEANPTASVNISGDLSAGTQIDGSIQIATIPDNPHYGYIYVQERPALVDMNSRTIVWVE